MKGFALANRIAEAPYNKLESMMWAVIAMRAGGGQKEPPNVGMATDIKTVSRLLPTAMSCSLIENAGRYSRTSKQIQAADGRAGLLDAGKTGVPCVFTQSAPRNVRAAHRGAERGVWRPGSRSCTGFFA